MRTSPAGNSCHWGGFTLIEVLIVLTILGLAAALTGAAFGTAVENARYEAGARDVLSGLRETRRLAIAQQREAVFALDTRNASYAIDGRERSLALADGSMLSLVTAESEQSEEFIGSVRFFADGSSTGGEIRISRGSRELVVLVDWLTGRVALEP